MKEEEAVRGEHGVREGVKDALWVKHELCIVLL